MMMMMIIVIINGANSKKMQQMRHVDCYTYVIKMFSVVYCRLSWN